MGIEFKKDNTAKARALIRDELEKLADEESSAIMMEAKTRAPYSKVGITKRQRSNRYEVVAGSRKRFWAGFVEWGTAQQPAQPFMTPAAEHAQQRISSRMRSLSKLIDRLID